MLFQLKRSSSLRGFMPVYSLEITDDGLMVFRGQLWNRYNTLGNFRIETIERQLSKKQIDDISSLIKNYSPISVPQVNSQVAEYPSATLILPETQKEITALVSYWDEMNKDSAHQLTKIALQEAMVAPDDITVDDLNKLADFNFLIYQIEQIIEVPQLIRSFFLTKETGKITRRSSALVNWEQINTGEISVITNNINPPDFLENILNTIQSIKQLNDLKLVCMGVCDNQEKRARWIQTNEKSNSLTQHQFLQLEFFKTFAFPDDPILAIQIISHTQISFEQKIFLNATLLATTNSSSLAKEVSEQLFVKLV